MLQANTKVQDYSESDLSEAGQQASGYLDCTSLVYLELFDFTIEQPG